MAIENAPWTADGVRQIAKCQKFVIYLFLLQVVELFLIVALPNISMGLPAIDPDMLKLFVLVTAIVVGVLTVFGIYKMAECLKESAAILFALCTLVPLIGLVVVSYLDGKAAGVLRVYGVHVGAMGADESDLQQLGTQL